FVAGIESATNLSGLSCIRCHASALRACSATNGDPLSVEVTPQNWPNIFAQDSDGIVPLTSQLDRLGGVQVPGIIHSGGLEELNFIGPSELDPGAVPQAVINLLNESVTGPDFKNMQ